MTLYCNQIPCGIMNLISTIIDLIKIAVPILLIIYGMLDLGKSVVASNPDDIKKNRKMFIKRLINACLVFFVIYVVEMVVTISTNDTTITTCIKDIINNNQCTY